MLQNEKKNTNGLFIRFLVKNVFLHVIIHVRLELGRSTEVSYVSTMEASMAQTKLFLLALCSTERLVP
jgi:hypothetical protein